MKKLVALMVALTMVLGLAAVASAADYPTKGLIAINPWSAGGGTDNCLRAFCSALEKQLGVSVTVDNQTGASGVTGHEAIADADPDGYTIGRGQDVRLFRRFLLAHRRRLPDDRS